MQLSGDNGCSTVVTTGAAQWCHSGCSTVVQHSGVIGCSTVVSKSLFFVIKSLFVKMTVFPAVWPNGVSVLTV